MWKPFKQCKVCSLILNGDNDLKQAIYNSTKFTPEGDGLSLKEIQRQWGDQFHYNAIVTHTKKHQTLDNRDRIRRNQAIVKEIKSEATLPAPIKATQPEEVWQEALSQGLESLKAGELKLTARDVLKAATDKANIDLKKKDQEFKLAEMIYHFSSGEASNATAYDKRIIEGEAPTAYDAADITARNITEK